MSDQKPEVKAQRFRDLPYTVAVASTALGAAGICFHNHIAIGLFLAVCGIAAGFLSRKLLKEIDAEHGFRWSLGGVVAGFAGVLLTGPAFLGSLEVSIWMLSRS